jgi:hypothetical protein
LISSQLPANAFRRVLENAGILSFASFLVMSIALGRYTGALVWFGALLVFFAQAWEGRVPSRSEGAPEFGGFERARSHRFDVLRWLGLMLALGGATLAA